MTDDEIKAHAEVLAHSLSKACQNRASVHQNGHGKACSKLAKQFELAMKRARDE